MLLRMREDVESEQHWVESTKLTKRTSDSAQTPCVGEFEHNARKANLWLCVHVIDRAPSWEF